MVANTSKEQKQGIIDAANGIYKKYTGAILPDEQSNKLAEVYLGNEYQLLSDIYKELGQEAALDDERIRKIEQRHFPNSKAVSTSLIKNRLNDEFNKNLASDYFKRANEVDFSTGASQKELVFGNGNIFQGALEDKKDSNHVSDEDMADAMYNLNLLQDKQDDLLPKDDAKSKDWHAYDSGLISKHEYEKRTQEVLDKAVKTRDTNAYTDVSRKGVLAPKQEEENEVDEIQRQFYGEKVSRWIEQNKKRLSGELGELYKKQNEFIQNSPNMGSNVSRFGSFPANSPYLKEIDRYESILKNYDKAKTLINAPSKSSWSAFFQGMKDTDFMNVLTLGVSNAVQSIRETGALDRVYQAQQKGEAPDSLDQELVNMMNVYQNIASVSDPSVAYQIGLNSIENMAFIAQMALTSGAGTFAAKGLTNIATKNLAKKGISYVGGVAAKTGAIITKPLTQAGILVQHTAANAAQRQKGNYDTQFRLDENGNGQVDVEKIGDESLTMSSLLGYVENAIEVGSESLGDVVDPGLKRLLKKPIGVLFKGVSEIPYMSKVGNFMGYVSGYGDNPNMFQGIFKRFLNLGSLNSMPMEYFEEMASKAANNFLPLTALELQSLEAVNKKRAAAGKEPITRWYDFFNKKEALVILGNTAFQGTIASAMQAADLGKMSVDVGMAARKIDPETRADIIAAMNAPSEEKMIESLRSTGIRDISDPTEQANVTDYIRKKMSYDAAIGNRAAKNMQSLQQGISDDVDKISNIADGKIRLVTGINGKEYAVLAGEVKDGTGVLSVREIVIDSENGKGFSYSEAMQIGTSQLKPNSEKAYEKEDIKNTFIAKSLSIAKEFQQQEIEQQAKEEVLQAQTAKWQDIEIAPNEKMSNDSKELKFVIIGDKQVPVENGESIQYGQVFEDGTMEILLVGEKGATKEDFLVTADQAKRAKYEFTKTKVAPIENTVQEGENAAQTVAPIEPAVIPKDKKGIPLYEQVPAEATAQAYKEKYGEDAVIFVDAVVSLAQKELGKIVDKTGRPKPTGNPARDEVNFEKTKVLRNRIDYWNGVKGLFGEKASTETEVDAEIDMDDKGIPFVKASDGSTVFGQIGEEQAQAMGTNVEAPVKLSEGNNDYGKIHIAERLEQLNQNGYKSVEDFVEDISKNYDEVRNGNLYQDKDGNEKETFLLVKRGPKGNTLYIELSSDGKSYNVNSGGVFKNSYINKRGLLWNASTEHSTSSAATQDFPTTQLNTESEAVSALSQNNPLSNGKGTTKIENFNNSKGKKKKEAISPFQKRIDTVTSSLGDVPHNIRQVILLRIVNGAKFDWVGTGSKHTRGLAYELGYTNNKGERNTRIGILKNGEWTPDSLAEDIASSEDNIWGLDSTEIKNELLDVLQSVYSRNSALVELEGNIERFQREQAEYYEQSKEMRNKESEQSTPINRSPSTTETGRISQKTLEEKMDPVHVIGLPSRHSDSHVSNDKGTTSFENIQKLNDLARVQQILETTEGVPMPAPIKTIDEFRKEFANPVITPINEIVVTDNVFNKIIGKGRRNISGSIKETLETPNFIIKDTDESNLFVKIFTKDGVKNYNVVAVNKSEIVDEYLSSVHVKTDENILNKIKNGAKLHHVSLKETLFDERERPSNSTPFNDKGTTSFENTKENTNFANHEYRTESHRENSSRGSGSSQASVSNESTPGENRKSDGIYRQKQDYENRLGERNRAAAIQRGRPLTLHEQQDIENRVALDFAKDTDIWIQDIYDLGRSGLKGGNENTLVLDEEHLIVYKSNNLSNSEGKISTLLASVDAHNKLFQNSVYEFAGFTGIDNGNSRMPYIEVVLKQDYIKNPTQASLEDISDYMTSLGFEQVNDHTFKNADYIVSDLRPRNVLKDEEGNIHVIDDIIRPNNNASIDKETEFDFLNNEATEAPFRDDKIENDESIHDSRKKAIKEAGEKLLEKLGMSENAVFVEDVSSLPKKYQRAKGWFDPADGKLYIVLPKASSTIDIRSTIWHEAVGHLGLRKLVGSDNFDTFLDNAYKKSNDSVKAKIDARISYYKESDVKEKVPLKTDEYYRRLATEELFAEQVERGFSSRDTGFLNTLYQLFLDLLSKLGFGNKSVTEKDFRRLLWLSKNNLQGKYAGEALDILAKKFGVFKMIDNALSDESILRDLRKAEKGTDTNPTEEQKKAGNYKKGHITIDGLNISIEQAVGSIRSGKDKDGKEWSNEQKNTYGYIRGTNGKDGDHIDVYFGENIATGKVFVIDQSNEDRSFDEHKVMYGFLWEEQALDAYLSNYNQGWNNWLAITEVSKEDFKNWVDTGTKKAKPFAEYKISKGNNSVANEDTRFRDIDFINERFNAELGTTTEENAQSKVLHLGMPSEILLSSGIPNKPLRLYGNKLLTKAKKHGFKFSDINNLPKAISNPIAIFEGNHENSYAILTEIGIGENKVLASIETNKNGEVDFNLISSVFGKSSKGIVNWINNNKLRFTNKEKTLSYLSASALNADATNSSEFLSATKVIENFENPKLNDDVRFRDDNGFRSEERSIIDKAKSDDTYMLAPNGKPTKLNEKQWAQVRTKAFKDWFGDWEKATRIEKLKNSKTVEITGEEYKGKYELNRDSAKAYIKDNLRENYTIKDTGETILLAKDGAQKVTSHSMGNDAHLKSIAGIPLIIENSIFIDELPNEKDNGKYKSYRYYVCGLNIGGVDYTIKTTIGVDDNGNKYYDHSLTEIEKGKLIDEVGALSTTLPSANKFTLNEYKDTKLLSILQNNSSKVVDENGEPMVVYHGTDSEFYKFKREYQREDVQFKPGFFFTENPKQAYLYGDNVMAVYLRVDTNNRDSRRNGLPVDHLHNSERGIWIVNAPSQIKSATDNVGAFDASNDDIRFRDSHRDEKEAREMMNGLKESVKRAEVKRREYDFAGDVVKNFNEPILIPKKYSFVGDVVFREEKLIGPDASSELRRSMQDSDIDVRKLQDFIIENGGKVIGGRSDIYNAKNHSMSRIMDATLRMENTIILPLLNIAKDILKITDGKYKDLSLYTMGKHMNPRNDVMRKDAVSMFEKSIEEFNDKISTETDGRKINGYNNEIQKLKSQISEIAEKDYAGVTEFETVTSMSPQEYVQQFEDKIPEDKKHLIDDYWKAIKKATDYSVDVRVDGGLLSYEQGEEIKGKFLYYVPLRGWDTENQKDFQKLEYITRKGKGNPFSKKAKGRSTLADDPLMNIQKLNFEAIRMAEENRYKLAALRLAEDNNDEKFFPFVRKVAVYYVRDESPNSEGQYAYRETTQKPSQYLYDQDRVMEVKPPRVSKEQQGQHIVEVMKFGTPFQVHFGDPLVANAINGNIKEWDIWVAKAFRATTSFLTQHMTSKNPAFAVANLVRDMGYVSTTFAAEKGLPYVTEFMGNYKMLMKGFMWKFANGTVIENPSTETERLFNEWLRRGGRTGFTSLKTPEQIKIDMKNFFEGWKGQSKASWLNPYLALDRTVGHAFETVTAVSENATRFAVFLTTLKTEQRNNKGLPFNEQTYFSAITDSKNCSTNFDRRGTHTSSVTMLYGFFNATIQASMRTMQVAKRHKGAFLAIASAYAALGFVEAMYNCYDDEDYYLYQSDFTRANYLVFGEFRIWFPHFFRALKNVGVQTYLYSTDRRSFTEAGVNALSFLTGEAFYQAFDPLSYFEYDKVGKSWDLTFRAATPTAGQLIYDLATNTNFMGSPIHKDYHKNAPSAYSNAKNVNKGFKWFTDEMAALGGLDPFLDATSKSIPNKNEELGARDVNWFLDWNPSILEHSVTSILAGTGTTINGVYKMADNILNDVLINDKAFDWSNVPVVNKVYAPKDEKKIMLRKYYDMRREYEYVNDVFDATYNALANPKNPKDIEKYREKGIMRLTDLVGNRLMSYSKIFDEMDKVIGTVNKSIEIDDSLDDAKLELIKAVVDKKPAWDAIKKYNRGQISAEELEKILNADLEKDQFHTNEKSIVDEQ